jgi:hypothetical protein
MNNMFSRPLLGTDKKKTTMTWFEYIFTHLIPTWFSSFNDNFRMWRDLLSGNYANYALLPEDDPYEECYDWFWSSINLDETYPKEFLDYLMQMVDDIDTGKEKLIPMEDVMKNLKSWCEEPEDEEDTP